MQKLGGFFDKFNSKITKQVHNFVSITEIIKKHTGIVLDFKDVSISNGILRLKGSSLQKNVIYIKKTAILKDLESQLRGLKITDIH